MHPLAELLADIVVQAWREFGTRYGFVMLAVEFAMLAAALVGLALVGR